MDYNNQSDSSGTDDDLPPSHSNRGARGGGRPSGNGRAAGASVYGRSQPPTADQQIRKLELDAYTAVLRAFGAQSEVITWAKERLMSDLRKELRVPDEQHRELLGRVAGDDTLRQIREWRPVDESAPPPSAPPPVLLDPSPSPAVSQSRKKQKTTHVAQVTTPLPPPPPPPVLKPAPSAAPAVPSPAPSKRGVPVGPRGKKSKMGRQPPVVAASTPKAPVGVPASGRNSNLGRGPAPGRSGAGAEAASDSYLGKRVKTRWPDDNTFYEAVITDYDQEKGKHALVYDMGTAQETWEWVNLKEMSKGDMKWVEGPPISLVNKPSGPPASVGRGGGRGMKRGGSARGGSVAGAGRARGSARGQPPAATAAIVPVAQTRSWRGAPGAENGLERKGSRTLQIPIIDPLLKEAENLDEIVDIEKLENLKRKAKAQEEALRAALVELGESSEEAESDDGAHGPSSHTRSVDRERVNRSRQDSRDRREDTDEEEDTAGDGRGEGSDGEPVVGEGGGASDGEHHGAEEGEEDDEDG
ncbi:hypothetical protein MPTK1_2g23800 [Marchantia polymorpha subsp. ruderalis]|uniref:ENT domain-containing protein n=1 Tax=Marchantia polymorpha TaxID=3197 RepID=A0A2R6WPA0_MARPO|nr:hypothetical protein MARPO_0069s0030 [Marchantia polymorpha]BBN03478.1 hypothetical protein Mp_2g23800 [Marchantia polymorpha subsp. ruderalis]|eukprot:PTQ35685.1 hypothetical protein MARPO_0069s0030 [Marchantia polymorpha]